MIFINEYILFYSFIFLIDHFKYFLFINITKIHQKFDTTLIASIDIH